MAAVTNPLTEPDMTGQALHKFDRDLCRYVVDNIVEYLDRPPFFASVEECLSPPLFAHLLARRDGGDPPDLLLGKIEFEELSAHFSGGPIELYRAWSGYPGLHRRYIDCITEIRECLAPRVADGWANASEGFSAQLESERLKLHDGIDIVWAWTKELRRLLRAMGAVQWLPAPEGRFPTPAIPEGSTSARAVEQDRETVADGGLANPASLRDDLIAPMLERLAAALEKMPSGSVSTLPPEALAKEDAAKFLGVEVAAIEYLIRTRKIEYVQYGEQRGRVVPVDSLRKLIESHRQCTAADLLDKSRK